MIWVWGVRGGGRRGKGWGGGWGKWGRKEYGGGVIRG